MRNVRWISLAASLTLLLTMFGCATQPVTKPQPTAPVQSSAKSEAPKSDPVRIRLVSGSAGNTLYLAASAHASVLEKAFPSWKIEVGGSQDSTENPRILEKKEADVGYGSPSYFVEAFQGKGKYGTPHSSIRYVATGYVSPLQIAVMGTSDIKSVKELKGKKVAVQVGVHRAYAPTMFKPEFVGYSYDDIKVTQSQGADAVQALRDGLVDAILLWTGAPQPNIGELANSKAIRLIPIEKELADKWFNALPQFFMFPGTIPANTYKGIDKATPTMMLSVDIFARADVPDQVIYDYLSTIYAKKADAAKIHPSAGDLSVDRAYMTAGTLPVHPGAEKYYSEKGVKKPTR